MKKLSFFHRAKIGLAFAFGRNYESAAPSRFRSRSGHSFATDAHREISEMDLRELHKLGRDFTKNSGFFREICIANSIYSVGDGLTPQPHSVSPEWNARAKKYFERWARRPELSGRFPFWQCQDIVCREIDAVGEVFAVKTEADERPRLQFLEVHRLSAKTDEKQNIVQGIKIDDFGKPVAYFFESARGDVEVPASDVIHVFAAERFSEVRGVSPAQHAFNVLTDAKELRATEVATNKLINSFGVCLQSKQAVQELQNESGININVGDNSSAQTARDDPVPVRLEDFIPAKALRINPDEEMKVVESNRPSQAWLGLMDDLDKNAWRGQLSVGFAEPAKLGGVAARLANSQSERMFARRQQLLISQFLDKVWLFVIGWAINAGELEAVEDWDVVYWATPKRLTVDTGRDAAQTRADVQAGLVPIADDFAARGLDFDSELETRVEQLRRVVKMAKDMKLPPSVIMPSLFPSGTAAAAGDVAGDAAAKDSEDDGDPAAKDDKK